MEQKRLLDQHTSIATALLDQIKARKLDTFFEIEEKMLSRQSQQQLEKQLMDLLNDPESGTPEDKLRLFIIAFLCGPPMSDVRPRSRTANFAISHTPCILAASFTF